MQMLLIHIAFSLMPIGAPPAQGEAPRSYQPYYQAINRAELAVAAFKYEQALHIYDSIFAHFPKHHPRDLHNAALCALLCNKQQKAQVWLMERVTKGWDPRNTKFNMLKQQPPDFWEPIAQRYDSLRTIYEAEVARWMRFKAALDTMEAHELRAMNDAQLSQSGYHAMLYAHAQRLHRMIDSAGIPAVPLFGNGQPLPMGVLKRHFRLLRQLQRGELDTSMSPYCDMDMERYSIEPLLIRAVFSGDMLPDLAYTYVHDARDAVRDCMYEVRIDLNTRTIELAPRKNANIAAANAKLMQYGLPPLADAMKKDVDIALYYNQESYPFDAIIALDLSTNHRLSALKRMPHEEQLKLTGEIMNLRQKIKEEHMANLAAPVGDNGVLLRSMTVLKDFTLTSAQGLYVISETPLE